MHVLALVNEKGGCGKTTAAVNLAAALAAPAPGAPGARVLLVDLDPQAHATLALGQAVGDGATGLDVLLGRRAAVDALREAPGGVRLLPAGAELAEVEEVAARLLHAELLLRTALAPLAGAFDLVLLDCPPRVDGVLAANALAAADTAVLVVETSPFALQGAVRARRTLEAMRTSRGYPRRWRALATLFDPRTRLARDILVALQARFGDHLFETAVRTSVRLREAAARGLPVRLLDRRARATADFASLAAEVRSWVRAEDAGSGDEGGEAEGDETPARARRTASERRLGAQRPR